MRSVSYQCDQCNDVILQGLSLETRFFTDNWGECDPALRDYRTPLHFCDIDCLHTFTQPRRSPATGD